MSIKYSKQAGALETTRNYTRKQQGVGIIEVLIALVVVSLGVLGMASLQLTGIKPALVATTAQWLHCLARTSRVVFDPILTLLQPVTIPATTRLVRTAIFVQYRFVRPLLELLLIDASRLKWQLSIFSLLPVAL